MRKPAIGILLVGMAFTVFSIPFHGIDLLIDSVGFLLMFNAVRALRLVEPGFGPGAWLCLSLVPVAAVQLFASGTLAAVLWLVRGAGTAAVCILLARGFGRMLAAEDKPKPAVWAVRIALWLCAVGALGQGIWQAAALFAAK